MYVCFLKVHVRQLLLNELISPIEQVKSTILEQLVVSRNVSFKELEAALGVTRWQWNQAQLGVQEMHSGKKQKAAHSVKMSVDKETVKKFVDCLRPDNVHEVAYGSRLVDIDDGTLPQWIRKSHRAKMAHAFKQEFSDKVQEMPCRTWMYILTSKTAESILYTCV